MIVRQLHRFPIKRCDGGYLGNDDPPSCCQGGDHVPCPSPPCRENTAAAGAGVAGKNERARECFRYPDGMDWLGPYVPGSPVAGIPTIYDCLAMCNVRNAVLRRGTKMGQQSLFGICLSLSRTILHVSSLSGWRPSKTAFSSLVSRGMRELQVSILVSKCSDKIISLEDSFYVTEKFYSINTFGQKIMTHFQAGRTPALAST